MEIILELHVDREEVDTLPFEKLSSITSLEDQIINGMQPIHYLDPVSVVVAVNADDITTQIADTWLRSGKRGVMIDLRGDVPVVSRILNVPEGILVVIYKDSTYKILPFDYSQRLQFISSLSSILIINEELLVKSA